MQTRFFKFPDMQTSFDLAHEAGLTLLENGEYVLLKHTHSYALDVIGVVGGVSGWHVNARILDGSDLPPSFLPFEVFPETPIRDFA